MQWLLIKSKLKLPDNVYKRLYSTGSYPGKLYEIAKVQKLSPNNVYDLTLRPVVSNIDTATYQTAKYLEKVPDGYRMVSFDTASLFTNFLLEETIEIVSKRIYVNKEISTDIPTQEME